MEQLALRYRPTTFDDLVGQRAVNVVLRAMVASGRIPAALLFSGSRGTGKTTTARILAAALNCEAPPGPCGECVSCKSVVAGTSLDLVEIDAASNGLVDDIRSLRTQVMYSVGGKYRVVVLDEAHSMSPAAFNALLKTLEEPPMFTVFILATTEPGKIPDTVVSRCMTFSFRRILISAIVGRLKHICELEQIQMESELLTVIAQRADGGLRDAIMLLDQLRRAKITTVAEYQNLLGEVDIAPALMQSLVVGDAAGALNTLGAHLTKTGDAAAVSASLTAFLRDLLILKSGGSLTVQGESLDQRAALVEKLDVTRIVAALMVLWDLKTKIRVIDDPRGNLELALVMVADKIASPASRVTASPPAKLTLAEMAAMRR